MIPSIESIKLTLNTIDQELEQVMSGFLIKRIGYLSLFKFNLETYIDNGLSSVESINTLSAGNCLLLSFFLNW